MISKLKNFVKEYPHSLALLYFVFYVAAFVLLERFAVPKYWISSPLDALIPFNEWFIFPYCLWFPYFLGALAFFLFRDRELFLKLAFVMFTGMTVCLTIYAIWPNGLHLRPDFIPDNLPGRIVGLMHSLDTPTNVCPSIHVASTAAVHWIVCRYGGFRHPFLIKGLSLAAAVSICLSTVFLKQHSVVDMFWGLVLTAALILVTKVWELHRTRKAVPQLSQAK